MGSVNGGGVGGSLPIAIGGALAHRKHGRLCVRFQADGDMLYVNSALWTATHHRIPMLFVMHNNRAYHQEVMHLQRMANRRQRGMALAARRPARARRSAIRTSTSRRWRAAWARMRRGPFEPEGPAAGAAARRGARRKGRSRAARHHHAAAMSSPGEEAAMFMRLVAPLIIATRTGGWVRTPAHRAATARRQAPAPARQRRERQEALRRASLLAVPRPAPPRAAGSPVRAWRAACRPGRRSRATCAGRPKR